MALFSSLSRLRELQTKASTFSSGSTQTEPLPKPTSLIPDTTVRVTSTVLFRCFELKALFALSVTNVLLLYRLAVQVVQSEALIGSAEPRPSSVESCLNGIQDNIDFPQ